MIKKIFSLVIFGILFFSLVSAFGVTNAHYRGNPFGVAPGETRSFNLLLQNMIGDEDVAVRAVLSSNAGGIIETPNRDYSVPSQTKDIPVPITVTMPADAVPGTMYSGSVSFTTITSGDAGNGQVAMGTGIDVSFEIIVAPTPTEEVQTSPATSGYLYWVVGSVIIAIFVVVGIVMIRRRRKNY